jgi:Ca-activated chloride channel family protein
MKMKTNQFWLTLGLAIILSLNVYSQVIKVSGIVTDETNSPINGVTVIEKGGKNGTITDVNGRYSIHIEKGKILIFSYIGFERKEIKVTGEKMNVKLKPNTQTLNEMIVCEDKVVLTGRTAGAVVTGYGRKNKVYGVQTINVIDNDYDGMSNEEYGKHKENRFISVGSEPLSTFSLDVDAASYGNIRRIINQGKIPEKDAVRIEEMLNYFSYNYDKPTGEHPVKITTEGAICPWNTKHKIVRIGVKAREIPSENLPASNFVFLIDVSGSMYGATRLELVKSSLKLLVNNLRDKDRVAIVVYAGAAGEVLPSTSGSDKQKIIEALQNLTAGGSTAGGAGIQLAYRIAEKNFMKGGNNRIILCTDGDFNVGVSSNDQLESLIEEKRSSGVYLTVLGYGMGNYKDSKLQTLAQKGNGNHAYIDNIQEANKVLVNEFGGTMFTVAKDVKLQVEFNPAYVNAYRLIGYESRMLNKEDFNDDTKDAGELGAGHTVTALYEIIPVGVDNTFGGVDNLKYQKEKNTKISPSKDEFNNEMLNVKLRYKQPDSDKSIKMEVPLLLSAFDRKPTEDMNFAMAVAMFGHLLRKSDFKGNATYSKVAELARVGLGVDNNGYRREFVRLVEAVKQMED